MFKRVIKIILILLAILLVTLGVIWLVGRHAAQKSGQTPLTFRQFLGLGTKSAPANTVPTGTDTSVFTGGSGSSNSGSATTGSDGGVSNGFTDNARISQFTNNGISLTNGANAGGGQTTNNNGSNQNSSNQGSIGGDAGSNTGGSGSPSPTSSTPICSDADTTISFTSDELAKLNQLQNRFYTIAQNLHTDADIATEVANHDAFAVKADQATELYNYCESKLPAITDPLLQQHVATPFWNDSANDSLTFLSFTNDPAQLAHLTSIHDNNTDTPDTSGIKGPYGLLSFSDPTAVRITGSVVKTNVSTYGIFGLPTPPDPLHLAGGAPGGTSVTRGPDYPQLIPVVEKILRINLW